MEKGQKSWFRIIGRAKRAHLVVQMARFFYIYVHRPTVSPDTVSLLNVSTHFYLGVHAVRNITILYSCSPTMLKHSLGRAQRALHLEIYERVRCLSIYVRPTFWAPGTHALRANVKPAHLPFGSKVIHTLRRQRTGFLVQRSSTHCEGRGGQDF